MFLKPLLGFKYVNPLHSNNLKTEMENTGQVFLV